MMPVINMDAAQAPVTVICSCFTWASNQLNY